MILHELAVRGQDDLEAAVRQLQELLKDPEVPEEMKEEIRKRLKDLPSLDYVR